MENMTDYQYAWMLYLIGAVGCSLATWLLFRRAGRFVVHFFVITVMVILFTPYAIDPETMTMAPAVYTLAFGYLDGGYLAIKPVIKLMLGFWIGALILSLIYQLLTRGRGHVKAKGRSRQAHVPESQDDQYAESARRASSRGLSREERSARDELLYEERPARGSRQPYEEPIRAIR